MRASTRGATAWMQDGRDPVPEPHAMPLAGVMQQRRGEQLGVVEACGEQPTRHLEAVSSIGHRHRDEEAGRAGGKHARCERLLVRE